MSTPPVLDSPERTQLVELLTFYERFRATGRKERRRLRRLIRRIERALDWNELRQQGEGSFLWRRPAVVPMFMAITAIGPIIQSVIDGTFTARQLGRLAVLLPIALGISWLIGRYFWRIGEREYRKTVQLAAEHQDSSIEGLPPD